VYPKEIFHHPDTRVDRYAIYLNGPHFVYVYNLSDFLFPRNLRSVKASNLLNDVFLLRSVLMFYQFILDIAYNIYDYVSQQAVIFIKFHLHIF